MICLLYSDVSLHIWKPALFSVITPVRRSWLVYVVWLGIFLGFGSCVQCVIPGGSRGAGFRLQSVLRAAIRRRSPAVLALFPYHNLGAQPRREAPEMSVCRDLG